MDSLAAAQADMRQAYYYGVPGIICSGSVWLAAAATGLLLGAKIGIATLVIGGTLIFPLSVLLSKLLGARGKHQPDNPLAALAIEGTFWMLLSIPIALGAAFYRIEWFFPAMLMVIGGRYLTFASLYGMKIYWLFALVLVAAGWACALVNAAVYWGALVGGLVEWLFAALIALSYGRRQTESS